MRRVSTRVLFSATALVALVAFSADLAAATGKQTHSQGKTTTTDAPTAAPTDAPTAPSVPTEAPATSEPLPTEHHYNCPGPSGDLSGVDCDAATEQCCGAGTLTPHCNPISSTDHCCLWNIGSISCSARQTCCGDGTGSNSRAFCCDEGSFCCAAGDPAAVGAGSCCPENGVCCRTPNATFCCNQGDACDLVNMRCASATPAPTDAPTPAAEPTAAPVTAAPVPETEQPTPVPETPCPTDAPTPASVPTEAPATAAPVPSSDVWNCPGVFGTTYGVNCDQSIEQCCGAGSMTPHCIPFASKDHCCLWNTGSARCTARQNCCGDGVGADSRAFCCDEGSYCCPAANPAAAGGASCCPENSLCCGTQTGSFCCDRDTQVCDLVNGRCASKSGAPATNMPAVPSAPSVAQPQAPSAPSVPSGPQPSAAVPPYGDVGGEQSAAAGTSALLVAAAAGAAFAMGL